MTEAHLLQVPVEGILHLYHSDTQITDEYAAKVLDSDTPPVNADEDPRPVSTRIEVTVDSQHAADIWFVPDPRLPHNHRARRIAADNFGWHMIFHGTVLILGLSEEQVAKVIADT